MARYTVHTGVGGTPIGGVLRLHHGMAEGAAERHRLRKVVGLIAAQGKKEQNDDGAGDEDQCGVSVP